MDASSLVGSHYLEDLEEPTTSQPLLISAGYDQCIKFWDVARGETRENFIHKDSQINTMRISPNGSFLAIAGVPPTLVTSCDAMTKNVTAIGFDDRCKWFYTAGEDCSVKIWDFRSSLHCRRVFQVNSAVNCIVIHPNQVTLIISDISGALYFWDMRSDVSDIFPNLNLDIFEHVTYVDINRTADTLVGVTNKGKIITWSISILPELCGASTTGLTLQQKSKIAAHSKYALKCHYSPDYKYFATTGADGYVHLWDATNIVKPAKSLFVAPDLTKLFHLEKMESQWVWDCAFTSDSKYLFTISGYQLRLWNLETEEIVRQYQGHNKMISCFAFREGRHVL
ncbi:Target of rapamycin complex subunit LST8 [Dirofilaria immitis]|nr:Target of rapamycin complex subunit LST8 [Dirofilaria immitis]